MPEFELIRRLQDRIAGPVAGRAPACVVGIGDDGAVLEIPPDRQLVVCTDTLNEGVHFPVATDPRSVGYKSLAVNLSDLAAMGAEPAWFFLNLALPDERDGWVDAFADGMAEVAADSGILLAGGDTTGGPLSVTVTALGLVEPGRALLRSGASEGDLVVVSGAPGRAAFALGQLERGVQPDPGARAALDYPSPRLALGRALAGLATACIDLSDGLLADLGHIAEQSGVGAEVYLDDLPAPRELSGLEAEQRWTLQLGGGDDYELCFTVRPEAASRLAELATALGLPLTVVGRITAGHAVRAVRPDGGDFVPHSTGYEHFATAAKGRGA